MSNVSLIRLKGDYTVNNKEIRNIFKQPLFIPDKAKVAVHGFSLDIQDDAVQSNYQVYNGDEFTADGVLITPNVAIYQTYEDLLNEFREQWYLAGAPAYNIGLSDIVAFGIERDFQLDYTSYQTEISKVRYGSALCELLSKWTVHDGNPAVTDNGGFDSNSSICLATSDFTLPNTSWKLHCTIDTVNELEFFGAYDADVVNNVWGFGINNAGNYTYVLRGAAAVDTGIPAVGSPTSDQISVALHQGNFILARKPFAGVWAVIHTAPVTAADFSEELVHLIDVPTVNPVILEFITNTVTDPDHIQETTLEIQSATINMARLLGWNDTVAHKASDRRNPVIVSPNSVAGNTSVSAIGFHLENFILSTYDGIEASIRSGSSSNLVYCCHTHDSQQRLERDLPFPIPLTIKNLGGQYIQELRMTFRDTNTLQPLAFVGNPIVTLLIYED